MQKKIQHLTSENEKLSQSNIEKINELDSLRLQRAQLEDRLRNETADLRLQVEELKVNAYVIALNYFKIEDCI